jgi:iron(III) transport system substrate-binding protein
MTRRHFGLRIALMLAWLAAASPLAAQESLARLAAYEGADRAARLAANAKKEGELSLYTSLGTEDVAAIAAVFEKKYGVKIKLWRASSEKILQRIVTESQAGRNDFDIVETISPELETLSREKMLQAVYSVFHADLLQQAVPAHKEWASTRLNLFTQAYNTKLIRKEDLPKTFDDLLLPQWKGKLGIEADDPLWLAAIAKENGESKTLQTFRDIARSDGFSVRKGHTLLTNLVVSGEVPLALTVYNYRVEQLKNKGAPINWFSIGPAIALPSGIAIARAAPHPNAALLFYDFMLSEGQAILAKKDFVPSSRAIDSPLTKGAIRFLDPATVIDQQAKWSKLYDEIIVKQSR